jgi:hypothetical protein
MSSFLRFILVFWLCSTSLHAHELSFSEYLQEFEREERPFTNGLMQRSASGQFMEDNLYQYKLILKAANASAIQLEEGSVWTIPAYTSYMGKPVDLPFRERLLQWDLRAKYKIVKYDLTKDIQFAIYNPNAMENERYVAIQLLESSNSAAALYIIDIRSSGSSITLSDGSQWIVGWYHSMWTKNWKIGDAIIPAYLHSQDKRPQILINADLGEQYVESTAAT